FPHFYAISWMYREDYARAGILMLPVVDREGTSTFRQIILYATALVGVSLLPAVLGLAGVVYFFGALVVCTALVQVCLWAASNKTNVRGRWFLKAPVLNFPLLLGWLFSVKFRQCLKRSSWFEVVVGGFGRGRGGWGVGNLGPGAR